MPCLWGLSGKFIVHLLSNASSLIQLQLIKRKPHSRGAIAIELALVAKDYLWCSSSCRKFFFVLRQFCQHPTQVIRLEITSVGRSQNPNFFMPPPSSSSGRRVLRMVGAAWPGTLLGLASLLWPEYSGLCHCHCVCSELSLVTCAFCCRGSRYFLFLPSAAELTVFLVPSASFLKISCLYPPKISFLLSRHEHFSLSHNDVGASILPNGCMSTSALITRL